MSSHLAYRDNITDAIPQTIEREDGRTVPFSRCLTLDERTHQQYSRPVRVESMYQSFGIGRDPIYRQGGASRPRVDLINDIEIDANTRRQAQDFGVDLYNPEDLLGTYFTKLDARGRTISVDDASKFTGRKYRRVLSFDAAPNLFVRRELQRLLPELVEIEKSRSDTARAIFPMENFGQVGLTSYAWEQIQLDSPEAMWGDPSQDRPVPTVRAERAEQIRRIVPLSHGFSFNWYQLEQIAAARANGAPDLRLESRYLEESRQQILRQENRGIMFGVQELGILGVLSQTKGTTDPLALNANVQGIPQVASPVPGKWLSEIFLGAEGNGEEMYDILTKTYMAISDATEEVEMPDVIALGLSDFININRKIYHGVNADSTDSVANVVLKNMAPLGLKAIVLLPELAYRQTRATVLATKNPKMNASDPYVAGNTYAQTYAGGLFQRNTILCFKRDVSKSSIIVGHDMLVRPPLDLQDQKETTVWLFSGGFLVKKPQSLRIIVAPTGP